MIVKNKNAFAVEACFSVDIDLFIADIVEMYQYKFKEGTPCDNSIESAEVHFYDINKVEIAVNFIDKYTKEYKTEFIYIPMDLMLNAIKASLAFDDAKDKILENLSEYNK